MLKRLRNSRWMFLNAILLDGNIRQLMMLIVKCKIKCSFSFTDWHMKFKLEVFEISNWMSFKCLLRKIVSIQWNVKEFRGFCHKIVRLLMNFSLKMFWVAKFLWFSQIMLGKLTINWLKKLWIWKPFQDWKYHTLDLFAYARKFLAALHFHFS